MKHTLTSIACLLHLFSMAQSWVPVADFPAVKRDDGVSFTIGNKAYCGTGMTPWYSVLNDFYSFDLQTEQWSTETSLPSGEERQYATGISNDSIGYIFGGTNGAQHFNDLWSFDPKTGNWQELTPMPDSGRSGSCGFYIKDSLYIIGGKTKTSDALADVWAYSIKHDSWTKKSNLPYSVWRASATSANSIGYLAFGKTSNDTYPKSLLQYNPSTDSWTQLSTIPQHGLTHSSLVSIDSSLFSIGGHDSLGRYSKNLFRYNINNNSWNKLSAIPDSARKGGMVFTNANRLYYTTGITADNNRLKQTWKCTDALISTHEFKIQEWSLFPNPVRDKLKVNLVKNEATETNLVITDIHGKVWLEKTINEQNSIIDMNSLPQGLYFARLKSSGYSGTIKLLKTH